ncbi:hypothetical protein FA13DRAFT_1778788 [Coprinellus micaceus]|uniref:CHAT domain-containing protein n=1 Tax=Coprinellus micaceus TaxID=71717 RepID=A0A4Y7SKW7_COPMI|nr:hypothetical protein FA13DRAFT_1778788 [Coprinellus micaceus]
MSQGTENTNDNSRTPDEDPCSHFYLTNVAVERVDELIDEELVSDIADLWVRDMEDLDDGKCYPLISETPNRWEVKGAIEIPHRVREIRCEVHCANGHTYSIVDADCAVASLREAPSKGFSKTMEGGGESENMVICWEFTIESGLGASGVAAHINACSCGACLPKLFYTPRATETLALALRTTPTSHPSVARCLSQLAKEHQRAFSLDTNPSHVDDALSALSKALHLTPSSHSDFLPYLGDIANIFMLRYRLTGDVSNLDEAISKRREAVAMEATPKENFKLCCHQNALGLSLYLRFKHKGNLSDLSDSITAQTKALEYCLERHTYLEFLATGLRVSFKSFTKQVDALLHDATLLPSRFNTDEVCVLPCGFDAPPLLRTLGPLLNLRFKRTGAPSDLAAAISIQRLLVHLTSGSHPDYTIFLHDLGSLIQSRFHRDGDLRDIDEAISLFKRSASGQHQPGCHTARLEDGRCCTTHSIASCFREKYQVTQDRDDLDEAICTLQEMINTEPHDIAHPCAAAWVRSLALTFCARFEHTRDLRDLSEAISIQERLVQRPHSQEHSSIISRDLVLLSKMLDSRFRQYGNLEDINRAISLGRSATHISSEDVSDLPLAGRLQSLAGLLESAVRNSMSYPCGLPLRQAGAGGSEAALSELSDSLALDYLTEAVNLSRKAVELTPNDDPGFPAFLTSLADCLHTRFDYSRDRRDMADIQEALTRQLEAMHLTPDHQATRKSWYRVRLAEIHHCRYSQTENDKDREEMVENYRTALLCQFQTPRSKLQAAVRIAHHCVDVVQAMAAYDAAADAAALVIGLDQTVAQLFRMPLEAAAVACLAHRPDKAIEWLEQGRCYVWGQLNILRTPLANLRAHNLELATDIAEVSKRLEEAGSTRPLIDYHMPPSRKVSLDDEARAHAKLAKLWDELLAKARSIPGFESFLKPLSCSTLIKNLPSSGNIIIVTAHKERCDAIALVAGLGEPLHIPLPDLTISKARDYRAILDKKLRAHGFRGQEVYRNKPDEGESGNVERGVGRYRSKDRGVIYVLKALWIEVVKPVLDALDIPKADDPSISTLHRVWWCPTGVLSFLPLHAAGVYSDAGSECVLDYVVSSYTPSISSLLERARNEREIVDARSGLFLTNQPKVPGYPRIAGTTREVNTIRDIMTERGVSVLKVEGSELSVDDCLKYMEEYSSVHFACHGSQNAQDPLKSRLRLEKGALELGAIMQKNLKHADFAFLSACETSTGEEKLDNEVVHLAAGMLAAGYRRVVGTMWEIRDSHAVDVANDSYSYLMDHRKDGSGSRFDGSRSAHALHHAVRQLRARIDDAREVRGIPDELEKSLLLWIPYVHYGY